MTFKDRLILFARDAGYTNRAIQKELGLSNAYIANLKGEPRPDIIRKIRDRFPQCNIAWLRNGEGEMLLPVNENDSHNTNTNEADRGGQNYNVSLKDESSIGGHAHIGPSTPATSANAYSLLAQVDVLNATLAELRETNQRLVEANTRLTEANQRKDEMMFQLFEMLGGRNHLAATASAVPTPPVPAWEAPTAAEAQQ